MLSGGSRACPSAPGLENWHNYDPVDSRLSKLEYMVADIYAVVVNGVKRGGAAVDLPSGSGLEAPVTPRGAPKRSASSTPTASSKRRKRAKRVKLRLWTTANGEDMKVEEHGKTMQPHEEPAPPQVNEALFDSLPATLKSEDFVDEFSLSLQGKGPVDRPAESGFESGDMTSEPCLRCGASLDSCFCAELFCRRCMMCAVDCKCPQPWVMVRLCASCSQPEKPIDMYTSDFFSTPLEPDLNTKCENCGGMEFCLPDDDIEGASKTYYCMNSLHPCAVCKRIDAQTESEPCEGHACSAMVHLTCARDVNRGRLRCQECVTRGNPLSDLEEDEEEDEYDVSGDDD